MWKFVRVRAMPADNYVERLYRGQLRAGIYLSRPTDTHWREYASTHTHTLSWHPHKLILILILIHTDRQTDRQIHTHTHTLTHRFAFCLCFAELLSVFIAVAILY